MPDFECTSFFQPLVIQQSDGQQKRHDEICRTPSVIQVTRSVLSAKESENHFTSSLFDEQFCS